MRFLVVLGILGFCLLVFGQENEPPGPPPPLRKSPFPAGWAVSWLPDELVKKFDKDGDGKLSKEEKVTAFKTTLKEFMGKFDANKDGKLSDDELGKVKEEVKRLMEEHRQKMVKEFDKNGDGKLSDEEKKAMREAFGEKREKARKEAEELAKAVFDTDGDGKLSKDEKRTMAVFWMWMRAKFGLKHGLWHKVPKLLPAPHKPAPEPKQPK